MEKKHGYLAVGILGFIAFLFWALPVWSVWKAELSGEAALAKATQTKSIMIETARAEKESATLRAEAIEIMGEAAKKYPEYRQQEFIQAFGEALREGAISQIIYVPTEGNIPVMESGRVSNHSQGD
ncbi:hypothetical protein QYZ44_26835 [Vibrio parahaemolyticus]|nr:hypothetical protein [Vibrio parahaemolyticus]MDN4712334.1 hypothetical protein [Vibrio parahaemolyticus]